MAEDSRNRRGEEETKLLRRTCMECGKLLFIIVEPDGTYSGGHYFGSFDLADEDSDGEHVKTGESVSGFDVVEWTGEEKTYEYWECDDCQEVSEKRLSATEAELFLSLLARVDDDLDQAFTDASEGVFGDGENESFEGKWGAPESQVMVEESRGRYRQFVKHAYLNANDETQSGEEAVEDAHEAQREINERDILAGFGRWSNEHADRVREVEEADRDDLKEHRERVREIIDEDREILDELAGPEGVDGDVPEGAEGESRWAPYILAEALGGDPEDHTVEAYIESMEEAELREWLEFYRERSADLYDEKLRLESQVAELREQAGNDTQRSEE